MKKIYLIIGIIIIFLVIGVVFTVQRKKAQTKNEKEEISIQKEDVEHNEELEILTPTVEYIDKIKSTGEVIKDEYTEYINEIKKINSGYNVEIESEMLDEKSNKPGLKYYTVTTSQIEDTLIKMGKYTLKEGDKINIIVINGENNEKVIEHGGIVAITNTSKNQN